MEHQLPLYCNGVPAGTIWRREEGLHSVFAVRCTGGDGIRKVWLCSENGGRLLLGTLVPEGDGWRTGRSVVRKSLEEQGLSGKLWGEVLANDNGPETGKKEQGVPVLPEDEMLKRLYLKDKKCRWTQENGLWKVVFQWRVGQPVPWLPLFCFARPGNGELHFLLDQKGYPAKSNEKSQK